jgi:hypothetical protein
MRPSKKFGLCALIVLVAVILPRLASGQSEAGTISGSVKDASGAVVARAKVNAKSIANGTEPRPPEPLASIRFRLSRQALMR